MTAMQILATAVFVITSATSASADSAGAAGRGTHASHGQPRAQTVLDARAEIARNVDSTLLGAPIIAAARAELADSIVRAAASLETANRLDAVAILLRREAYAISELPGLSADQNHRSIAAMEAAANAENIAGLARLDVTSTAHIVLVSQTALDHSSTLAAALAARTEELTAIIKSNGGISHGLSRQSLRP